MEFFIRNTEHAQLYTSILLGLLILITSVKVLYPQQFLDFIKNFINGKYFLVYQKIDKKQRFFTLLVLLFFSLNSAVFIYIATQGLDPENNYSFFWILFLIIGFLTGLFFIKRVVVEIIDIPIFFSKILFQKQSILSFSSTLISPITLLFISKTILPSLFISYICIGTIITCYLLSILIVVRYNQKLILKHWFYFILYLCALEIAPVLIGGYLVVTNF